MVNFRPQQFRFGMAKFHYFLVRIFFFVVVLTNCVVACFSKLFVDKDTLMNAVSASHDTHLLKIDNKVDKKNAVVFDLAVFLFGFVVVSLNNQRLFPRVYQHLRIGVKSRQTNFSLFMGKASWCPLFFTSVVLRSY